MPHWKGGKKGHKWHLWSVYYCYMNTCCVFARKRGTLNPMAYFPVLSCFLLNWLGVNPIFWRNPSIPTGKKHVILKIYTSRFNVLVILKAFSQLSSLRSVFLFGVDLSSGQLAASCTLLQDTFVHGSRSEFGTRQSQETVSIAWKSFGTKFGPFKDRAIQNDRYSMIHH